MTFARWLGGFVLVTSALLVGAVALVVQPFTGTKAVVDAGGVPRVPPVVDPRRLEAHVKHLSVDLWPRSHESFDQLERATRYVEAQFRAVGATDVSLQPVKIDEHTYANVVARFGPREPHDGPLVVVGAHVDSHGRTPGADDNASGVAGLIELAGLLARDPPGRAVELVAYTLEEPPYFRSAHMGSAHHARAMKAANRKVALMVSLEMIGFFDDAPGSQGFPLPGLSLLYPDRGDFIALVGRLGDFAAMRRAKALVQGGTTTLAVKSINAPPQVPGIDYSDHLNYWGQGIPAIMVTDTAFLRNHAYHTARDTHERLDYRRMAQVVQGIWAITQGY